jgi:hypothetical protein
MRIDLPEIVAAQAQSVLRDLSACDTTADLGRVYDVWKSWSAARGVAPAIAEHVTNKFHALRRGMGGSAAGLSSRSRAMSGDAGS